MGRFGDCAHYYPRTGRRDAGRLLSSRPVVRAGRRRPRTHGRAWRPAPRWACFSADAGAPARPGCASPSATSRRPLRVGVGPGGPGTGPGGMRPPMHGLIQRIHHEIVTWSLVYPQRDKRLSVADVPDSRPGDPAVQGQS